MTEEEELELLKKNSPASLPNNPSASGFSTAQIKEKFYAGLLLLYKWFKTLRIDVNAKVDGMQGLREELEAAMETFNKIISGEVPIGSAEKDGQGNVISSTYAKVSGLLEGLYPSLKYITENGGNEEIRDIEPRIMEALRDYAKIADLTEAINNLTSAINSKQNAITSSNKLPYSLLSDTPTIPTIPTNVSYFNNDAGYLTEHQDISGKQNVINENNPLPYDYLSGKPTIPSVYNATINFQLNGTTVKSVGLNQSSGDDVNIVVTKSTVGLSNVDNTSDLNKPISYAVQSALDLKADASSLSGKEDISHKVTNFTSPNDTNYPTTKAVADMVNSSVSQMASHPLKKNAQGDNFDTKAQLMSATKFYEGGVEKTPTYLDYVIVNNDETHNGETWRYKYNNQWEQDYKVNNRPFTEAENAVLSSGITSTKVATYDGYATLISNLQNGKQDKIDSSHKLAYTLISGTPTKLSDFTNDVGYLSSHQSLAGYATESWVNSQGFLTSHQDLSNYATKSWVEGKGYLVSSSLNGYATQSWVTSQGYLTEHQDISGKQDKSSLESDVSSKGFTKNTGTVTSVSVKMNGTTKGTVTGSGEIDLGTVITAHQDISGKANVSDLANYVGKTTNEDINGYKNFVNGFKTQTIRTYDEENLPLYDSDNVLTSYASGYLLKFRYTYSQTDTALRFCSIYQDVHIQQICYGSPEYNGELNIFGYKGTSQTKYGVVRLNGSVGVTGYVYHIHAYNTSSSSITKFNIRFTLRTSHNSRFSSNKFTALAIALYYAGHRTAETALPISGVVGSNTQIATGIYSDGSTSSSKIHIIYSTISATNNEHSITASNGNTYAVLNSFANGQFGADGNDI